MKHKPDTDKKQGHTQVRALTGVGLFLIVVFAMHARLRSNQDVRTKEGADSFTSLEFSTNHGRDTTAAEQKSLPLFAQETPPAQADHLDEHLTTIQSVNDIRLNLLSNPAATSRHDLDSAARWVRLWSKDDPAASISFALSLAPSRLRTVLAQQAVLGWCDSDLGAASTWIQNLTIDPDKPYLLEAVASEMVRTAPAESLALALQLTPGQNRSDLIHRALIEWESRDPGAPAQWTLKHPDAQLR